MSTLAKAKTTIELNGKLYDVRSGKIIGQANSQTQIRPQSKNHSPGMAFDGFIRPQKTASHAPADPSPASPISVPETRQRQKSAVSRAAAAHAARKPQKAKTLMRPAVKKPKAIAADIKAAQPVTLKKENKRRHMRAAGVQQSSLIKRFNHQASPAIVKKAAVLPVAMQADAAAQQLSQQVAHLATSTETQVKHSVDIIEEGLRNASSHLERFEDSLVHGSFLERFGFRNKAANLASLGVAFFLLTGFFAWQYAPHIQMRVAAAQSGVPANLPGYKPAGFSSASGFKAEPGKVSVTFRSNSDDRKFTITQQASRWSSDALLTNHIATSKRPYQTYQEEGKTVYIYENSNATWVNGGIWYSIDGDSSLTTDQLLRLANSL